jgi:hypothetical protein
MIGQPANRASVPNRVRWRRAWVGTTVLLVASVSPVVSPAGAAGPTIVDARVGAGADDAEEAPNGSVNLTSSDLELTFAGGDQIVGIRFANLAIPPGVAISAAHVQFQVDEASSEESILTIEGEAVDDALAFSSASGDISARDRTIASVGWSPQPWGRPTSPNRPKTWGP